jgi:pyruvate/2-oxoglutarate dehydrogenase complex dihydrolipoamide dehydrogenase (E3) component
MPHSSDSFDAIVVGAGQSGPFLAARLAERGQRVAVIEKRWLGGTCVNDGCMPTKTLVASARAAWVARNAARWGVTIGGPVTVDMAAVKARKDAIVNESRGNLTTWLAGLPTLEVIEGEARFVDAHTLKVGSRELTGARIFLNTGARPIVPRIPGLSDARFLTSESIMDLDVLPAHLVVLGGSYIGLEFAQMYRRFGSAVTVIERADRLIPREDPDISAELTAILTGEGIEVICSAEATAVTGSVGDTRVELAVGGATRTVAGSHILVAVGRAPFTTGLDLAAAGVAVDARGYITTDDKLVTSVPHIWALGDVNGRGGFTHTSYDDFQVVAANLLDGRNRRVSERIPIYGVFTDPPLGRCGMNATEARASGRRVLVGKRPMTRVGRARERDETAGSIQILVDADSRMILGATILGIEGDEAIHSIVDIMYADVPYTVLERAVHAHPTVSELIPTVLGALVPLEGATEAVRRGVGFVPVEGAAVAAPEAPRRGVGFAPPTPT